MGLTWRLWGAQEQCGLEQRGLESALLLVWCLCSHPSAEFLCLTSPPSPHAVLLSTAAMPSAVSLTSLPAVLVQSPG